MQAARSARNQGGEAAWRARKISRGRRQRSERGSRAARAATEAAEATRGNQGKGQGQGWHTSAAKAAQQGLWVQAGEDVCGEASRLRLWCSGFRGWVGGGEGGWGARGSDASANARLAGVWRPGVVSNLAVLVLRFKTKAPAPPRLPPPGWPASPAAASDRSSAGCSPRSCARCAGRGWGGTGGSRGQGWKPGAGCHARQVEQSVAERSAAVPHTARRPPAWQGGRSARWRAGSPASQPREEQAQART